MKRFQHMNLTPEQRIEAIKTRTEDIKTKKVQAEAQLQILQQQYDQKIEDLKQVGVTDLSNVVNTVAKLEAELQTLLTQTEESLSLIEASIT